ncbi:MAG TPA: nrdD protein [Candidatus Mailhella merdavium]|nr:nrdD protein [Candidatus Mailhella merdavium]
MMDIPRHLPLSERDGDIIIGEGVDFERIRRITGYLVGTTDRFNNAKRAEERDRVKHASMKS